MSCHVLSCPGMHPSTVNQYRRIMLSADRCIIGLAVIGYDRIVESCRGLTSIDMSDNINITVISIVNHIFLILGSKLLYTVECSIICIYYCGITIYFYTRNDGEM